MSFGAIDGAVKRGIDWPVNLQHEVRSPLRPWVLGSPGPFFLGYAPVPRSDPLPPGAIDRRPRCLTCHSPMPLVHMIPDKPGYDQRTYECKLLPRRNNGSRQVEPRLTREMRFFAVPVCSLLTRHAHHRKLHLDTATSTLSPACVALVSCEVAFSRSELEGGGSACKHPQVS